MVRGVKLEIYFAENTKHERVDLEDWLFGAARWAGISGGVMYRAVAGYGRHGELRDAAVTANCATAACSTRARRP